MLYRGARLTATCKRATIGFVGARRRSIPVTVDPRSEPAYTLAEAARYLRLAPGTLRSWVVGRPYPTAAGTRTFAPLIRPARKHPLTLSFLDLVEAHVLRALRVDHRVPVDAVRRAIRFAETTLRIQRLLLREDLLTHTGRVFLERYGELIDLSASGQLAMRKVLDDHLRRVEWDADTLPLRLYPFVSADVLTADKPIAIDPGIAFGRPVVQRAGVSTGIITSRIDAGESVADLAADYDLTPAEIEHAILYERAA
jgi:uncharacterized protein (DUF433 family)